MRSLMTLTVNGERREVAVPVHQTLLEVLREDLGLTGHQARLRAGRVRHLHRAGGRRAGALLPGPAGRVPGRARSLTVEGMARRAAGCTRCSRPSRSWAPPSAATARPGSCSPPRRCWTRQRRGPTRDEIRARAGRQPLPLHGLHQDPRRGRAGRRCACSGERGGRQRPMEARRERALLGHRAAAAQDRRLGQGDGRDALRRRPGPPAHGVRASSCAAPHPHARITADRHRRARAALPGVYAVITGARPAAASSSASCPSARTRRRSASTRCASSAIRWRRSPPWTRRRRRRAARADRGRVRAARAR